MHVRITPKLERQLVYDVCEVARQGLLVTPTKVPSVLLKKLADKLVKELEVELSTSNAYRFAQDLLGSCRVALSVADIKSALKQASGEDSPSVDRKTAEKLSSMLEKACQALSMDPERGAERARRGALKLLERDLALESWAAMQVYDAVLTDSLILLDLDTSQLGGYLSSYAGPVHQRVAMRYACSSDTMNAGCSGACACACDGYANQDACACASVTASFPRSTEVATRRLRAIDEEVERLSVQIEDREDMGVSAPRMSRKRRELIEERAGLIRLLASFGVRISKKHKEKPKDVKRYVEEHLEQGMDESKAWAIAWSRYCRKRPGSPRCKQDGYFKGQKKGGADDAKDLGVDPSDYTPEQRGQIIMERPWLHPRRPDGMTYVMRALSEPLARWQEYGSGKDKVFAAYNDLHEDLKNLLDVANRKAMGATAIGFRSSGNGKFPSTLGGISLHSNLEPGQARLGPKYNRAYRVQAKDVLMHPDVPNSPLARGSWKWEREMVLKPNAKPKQLSESETVKLLEKIAKGGR